MKAGAVFIGSMVFIASATLRCEALFCIAARKLHTAQLTRSQSEFANGYELVLKKPAFTSLRRGTFLLRRGKSGGEGS